MSDTMANQRTAPAAGWYADPSDAGSVRWWNGASWTASVRPNPSPATTTQQPTGQPAHEPSQQAGQGQEEEVAPRWHAPAHRVQVLPVPYEPGQPRIPEPPNIRRIAIWVTVLVVLAAVAVVAVKLTSGTDATPAGPVPHAAASGAGQLAAAKTDVRTMAVAEEKQFTAHHSYYSVRRPANVVVFDGTRVAITAGDQESVWLDAAGSAYCIVATTSSGRSAVYVSDRGGLQPGTVHRCPAGFAAEN